MRIIWGHWGLELKPESSSDKTCSFESFCILPGWQDETLIWWCRCSNALNIVTIAQHICRHCCFLLTCWCHRPQTTEIWFSIHCSHFMWLSLWSCHCNIEARTTSPSPLWFRTTSLKNTEHSHKYFQRHMYLLYCYRVSSQGKNQAGLLSMFDTCTWLDTADAQKLNSTSAFPVQYKSSAIMHLQCTLKSSPTVCWRQKQFSVCCFLLLWHMITTTTHIGNKSTGYQLKFYCIGVMWWWHIMCTETYPVLQPWNFTQSANGKSEIIFDLNKHLNAGGIFLYRN